MPPKACPLHFQRLIDRFNEQPSESNPIKQILKAFRDKKQGKSTDTVTVKGLSQITINLVDFGITVRDELELALFEIDLPNLAALIRECPVRDCGRMFWVGRDDKRACDQHVDRWRQREYRRNKKKREAEAQRSEAANRREEQAKKAISELSPTAIEVIRAIMRPERPREFWEIDHWASYGHRQSGEVVRSTHVVRQTINRLRKDGYLTYSESAEADEDRYEPTQKLRDLWAEMRKRPTH